MIDDIAKLKVSGPPGLLDYLEANKYGDHGELTKYALANGVELPEGYEPGWALALAYDPDGNEIGLLWDGYGPSDEDVNGFPHRDGGW